MFCMKCSQFFNKDLLNKYKNEYPDMQYRCPNEFCGFVLIEIDDALKFTIQTIYSLNLETMCSCSGHFHNKNSFTSFINFYQDYNYEITDKPHVDINELYKICQKISEEEYFKNYIIVEKVLLRGTEHSFWDNNEKELQYYTLRIKTITEKDCLLDDRIEIQSKFLLFCDKVLNKVWNVIEDMKKDKGKNHV